MTKLDLDEQIPNKTEKGEVEVIKIGDLIHKKLKGIYIEAVYLVSSGGVEGVKSECYAIQSFVDDIAGIIGIPKIELTEEEWEDASW